MNMSFQKLQEKNRSKDSTPRTLSTIPFIKPDNPGESLIDDLNDLDLAFHESEYEYDPKKDCANKKDTSFHYFINQTFDCIKAHNYQIVSFANNRTYTAMLYEVNKSYEVAILVNEFDYATKNNQKLKYSIINTLSLSQLGSVKVITNALQREGSINLTRQSFFPVNFNPYKLPSKSSFIHFQSISTLTFLEAKFPAVYLCAEDYLIIENELQILLVNFRETQITVLYNKENQKPFRIIYTYDEKGYSKSEGNKKYLSTRTYVFGISVGELHYFIIHPDNFNPKEIMIYPCMLDQNESKNESNVLDLAICKIEHETENKWFYFISIITAQKLIRYTTDWNNFSLRFLLLNLPRLSSQHKLWRKGNAMRYLLPGKKAHRRLFLSRYANGQSHLALLSGENVITISFGHLKTPLEMKEQFHMDSLDTEKGNFENEYTDIIQESEDHQDQDSSENENLLCEEASDILPPISQKKIKNEMATDAEITSYGYYNLSSLLDLDGSECKLTCFNQYLIVICVRNLWVLEKNKEHFVFHYRFLSEELLNFIQDPQLTSPFIVSKKRIFRFRYNERLILFNDVIKCVDPEDKSDIFDKDPISKKILESNLKQFSFRSYDSLFKNDKIAKLNEKLSEAKKYKCAICKKPGQIQCSECKYTTYCCEKHLKDDIRDFHFFECQIVKFAGEMKSMFETSQHYSQDCIDHLIRSIGVIMNNIFQYIHCEQDFQFYLIFIGMLIDLMDKFNFGMFHQNLVRLVDILPSSNLQQKTELHLSKIFLTEACFYYLNIKLLYVNFAIKAKLYRLADYVLRIFRDNLHFLKRWGDIRQDQKNEMKAFNYIGEKISLQIDSSALERYSHFSFFDVNSYINSENGKAELFDKFLSHYVNYYSAILKYFHLLSKYQTMAKYNDIIEGLLKDIVSIFEERIQDYGTQVVLLYSYFYASFYLVEIGKVYLAICLLSKTVQLLNDDSKNTEFKALCYYNLGLLQYSVGSFDEGIHNLEESHRIITEKNLSTHYHIAVLDSLSLAFINKKSALKSYVCIQQSIAMRNLITGPQNEAQIVKLKAYLNYIIDLFEYEMNGVMRRRNMTMKQLVLKKKEDMETECKALIDYVMGTECLNKIGKQMTGISPQDFVNVLDFFYSLSKEELAKLNNDNILKPKAIASSNGNVNEHHMDKLNTGGGSLIRIGSDNSLNTSQSIINVNNKDILGDKEESESRPNEEIEIKSSFFDYLPRNKQDVLKTLNSNLFRRLIILRDPLGVIDQFNLNYHPVHTRTFRRIYENIEANFLVKELTQAMDISEVQDDFFKYDNNDCLIGLSRYLKKENITNMITFETFKTSQLAKHNDNQLRVRSTLTKLRSMNHIIKYADFLPYMIDQLDFHDYPYANDILYQIYSQCDYDYLKYIMEHPQTVLNFIFSDANILEEEGHPIDKEKEKVKEKLIEQQGRKEDDEEEDDDDENDSKSVQSLQRKDNVFRQNVLEENVEKLLHDLKYPKITSKKGISPPKKINIRRSHTFDESYLKNEIKKSQEKIKEKIFMQKHTFTQSHHGYDNIRNSIEETNARHTNQYPSSKNVLSAFTKKFRSPSLNERKSIQSEIVIVDIGEEKRDSMDVRELILDSSWNQRRDTRQLERRSKQFEEAEIISQIDTGQKEPAAESNLSGAESNFIPCLKKEEEMMKSKFSLHQSSQSERKDAQGEEHKLEGTIIEYDPNESISNEKGNISNLSAHETASAHLSLEIKDIPKLDNVNEKKTTTKTEEKPQLITNISATDKSTIPPNPQTTLTSESVTPEKGLFFFSTNVAEPLKTQSKFKETAHVKFISQDNPKEQSLNACELKEKIVANSKTPEKKIINNSGYLYTEIPEKRKQRINLNKMKLTKNPEDMKKKMAGNIKNSNQNNIKKVNHPNKKNISASQITNLDNQPREIPKYPNVPTKSTTPQKKTNNLKIHTTKTMIKKSNLSTISNDPQPVDRNDILKNIFHRRRKPQMEELTEKNTNTPINTKPNKNLASQKIENINSQKKSIDLVPTSRTPDKAIPVDDKNKKEKKKLEELYHFDYGFNDFLKDENFSKVHDTSKDFPTESGVGVNMKTEPNTLIQGYMTNLSALKQNPKKNETSGKGLNINNKPILSFNDDKTKNNLKTFSTNDNSKSFDHKADERKQKTTAAISQPKIIFHNSINKVNNNKTNEDIINYEITSGNSTSRIATKEPLSKQNDSSSLLNLQFNSERSHKVEDIFKDSDFKTEKDKLMDINNRHVVQEEDSQTENQDTSFRKRQSQEQNLKGSCPLDNPFEKEEYHGYSLNLDIPEERNLNEKEISKSDSNNSRHVEKDAIAIASVNSIMNEEGDKVIAHKESFLEVSKRAKDESRKASLGTQERNSICDYVNNTDNKYTGSIKDLEGNSIIKIRPQQKNPFLIKRETFHDNKVTSNLESKEENRPRKRNVTFHEQMLANTFALQEPQDSLRKGNENSNQQITRKMESPRKERNSTDRGNLGKNSMDKVSMARHSTNLERHSKDRVSLEPTLNSPSESMTSQTLQNLNNERLSFKENKEKNIDNQLPTTEVKENEDVKTTLELLVNMRKSLKRSSALKFIEKKEKPDEVLKENENSNKNTESIVNVVPIISTSPQAVPSVPSKVPEAPVLPGKPQSIPGVPGIPSLPGKPPGIPGVPVAPAVPGTSPGIPGKVPLPSNQAKGKTKAKVKPTSNMKPLYWNTIDPKKIENTLWENMDDNSIISLINANKFEEEFSSKKVIAQTSAPTTQKKAEPISILPPQRQQNISMVLGKLKTNYKTIADALKSYDTSKLTQNACELLLPILPVESEINTIKGIDDISQYGDCEKFIFFVGGIPGYDLRIKSLIFKYSYPPILEELKANISQFRSTINIFKTDARVTEWLKIILAYGNYLNGTSVRGGAFGFKLETLNQLSEIKSNDNKKTLLQFIVEWLLDKDRTDLLDVKIDIDKDLSIQVISENFREVKKNFGNVSKLREMTKTLIITGSDMSSEFLSTFYSEVECEINAIERDINGLDEMYESLCKFFGENSKDLKFEQFISIFHKFFKEVEQVKISIIKQQEKRIKNK